LPRFAGGALMDEVGRLTVVVVATLALTFAPALVAIWFLQRRKRNARQLRRSPLASSLLRSPGQTLRDKMEDLRIDVGMESMLLLVVPTFLLAFLQIHALVTDRPTSPWVLGAVTVLAVAFVGFQTRKLLAASAALDKLRLGFDAEVAIGQELDQLMRDGAYVFHDVPAERFNIDHVVVARSGLFAVETKGYSKPNREGGSKDATVVYDGKTLALPDSTGSWAIEQATRQAKWLSNWLTGATGAPVVATPVLAMPGWYVERKGSGDVLVFSGKELQKHLLKARGAQPLAEDQLQRVIHQLERQCRNVAPTYRPETGEG
jgi:hypothetical protein